MWVASGVRDRSKLVLQVCSSVMRLFKTLSNHDLTGFSSSSGVQYDLVRFRQSGPSGIGSDLSIVLDNSRESDDVNLRIPGFEVLPQVLR